MPLIVDVSIAEDLNSEMPESGEADIPEPALLQAWAQAAYLQDAYQQATPAVASMLVTTAEEIRQLNKQYRNKDKATNVLSFPMESPEEVDLCLLGDIVLCAKVIKQEAREQAKPELSHWAHMVVHGMLHLQGYDHVEDDEAEEMEQKEIFILNQLGFDDPYNESK
jgi:probable rRNA maturation factor